MHAPSRPGEPGNEIAAEIAADDQRIETPADLAERKGEEPLSVERWTDAELKQRAKDVGLPGHDTLSRAQLIEQLRDK